MLCAFTLASYAEVCSVVASHAERYSLCVQLHILVAIPDVECVGSFKIVTLQNLNVL
jgi:hypothetical protein